jgi:hypothetical protein
MGATVNAWRVEVEEICMVETITMIHTVLYGQTIIMSSCAWLPFFLLLLKTSYQRDEEGEMLEGAPASSCGMFPLRNITSPPQWRDKFAISQSPKLQDASCDINLML